MSRARDIADLVDANGDVKTGNLDNVQADVVDDTTPQLGGDLSTNGNDVNFGDNDKAQFGAGNDLQIFHNGSNSYIDDAGTGDLFIRAAGNLYITNADGSENYARFAEDNFVSLYYDNAVKLQTTSTGIDVTGNVITDGFMNSQPSNFWSSNNDYYDVSSLGALATQGSYSVDLTSNGYRNSSGTWTSLDANSQTGASQISLEPTGVIRFKSDATKSDGDSYTISERMRINSSGNVGIGTASPSSDAIVKFLHINDGTSAGLVLDGPEKFSIYSSSSSALVFRNEDTDTSPLAIYDNDRIGYKSEASNNIRSNTDMRQGAAKMWGHVNQNGTQGVQDSYNLASITDNGTGRTQFTISNNMGNATYVVSGLNRDGGGYNDNTGMHPDTSGAYNAGAFEIFCHHGSTGNDGIPLVAVHGDLA